MCGTCGKGFNSKQVSGGGHWNSRGWRGSLEQQGVEGVTGTRVEGECSICGKGFNSKQVGSKGDEKKEREMAGCRNLEADASKWT